MKVSKKFILYFFVFILVVVEVLLLKPSSLDTVEDQVPSMNVKIVNQVEAEKFDDEIKYSMTGVKYALLKKNHKDSLFYADNLVLLNKNNLMVADTAKIFLFDEAQKTTQIQSKKVFFKMSEKDLELKDNVYILFHDGVWVRTSSAFYNVKEEKFSSKDYFWGETPKTQSDVISFSGVGFEGSKKELKLTVLGQVKVKAKNYKTNQETNVFADRAMFDRQERKISFFMDSPLKLVNAKQDTLNISSKIQTLFYDEKSSKIKKLQAEENVFIEETDPKKASQGLKTATCELAEFEVLENKLILSKFPTVYQENDTLTGEVITFYRDKNIVEVLQANAYHEGKE